MKFLSSLVIFTAISCFAYSIEIPEGGTNMIADAITNYTKIGSNGSISVVDADHAEFNQALKVEVKTLPENYWNFQVQFETTMPLNEGDVCLFSFWARTTQSNSEAGEGLVAAVIEDNQTYEKPLSHTFSPGGEWTHFVYGFKSDMSLPLEKHKAALFVGHAVQTLEVANVQFLNYQNKLTVDDLPETVVTWAGMEPEAAWRDSAAERIEKFRKGNVTVKLVDSQGNPVNGVVVNFTMQQHKFAFGTAIDGKYYLSNATYRNHVHELFNEVVFENDLKWKPWASRSNHSYIMRAIDSLHNNGFSVRGHNLIWPGWNYLPSYLETNKENCTWLKQESMEHIEAAAGYTKGKLVDWDVLNEPYTNHVFQDVCGDEIMAQWFIKTKEVDPEVKRYINDYSIVGNGGVNKNHQDGYFDIIEYIDNNGGQIDGIGMQGHFAELMTGIPKVLEIIDRFARLNKEIKITEFDINSNNDELKANYTRDFMTATFSHPHVKGFLYWGFWAGRHWKPEAAIFNMDWTIRPQGEMYKNLVFNEWWTTPQNVSSNASGMVNLGSCFLGTYQLQLEHNGKTILKSVPVHFNNQNEIVVNVDSDEIEISGEQHADTPVFTAIKNRGKTKTGEVNIYPNPATSHVTIQTSGWTGKLVLAEVFSITGNLVIKKEINLTDRNTLSLNGIEPGLYFIKLSDGHQQYTGQIVVR